MLMLLLGDIVIEVTVFLSAKVLVVTDVDIDDERCGGDCRVWQALWATATVDVGC